jgi:hypothetical protein
MITAISIPEPLLLNPLKHHLGYIRHFSGNTLAVKSPESAGAIIREIKHIGGSVMDVYSGTLSLEKISRQVMDHILADGVTERDIFRKWAGPLPDSYKTVTLSDKSDWILKYFENEHRFIHLFPARYSPHAFRIKANTLKSALLYTIFIGKDFITEEDVNTARAMAGLSPVKDIYDSEAISEMIEMIRN